MAFTLRDIEEADLEKLMHWRMDPEITKYMNTDPVLTLEGQRKWLQAISEDESSMHWMIEVDGRPAGLLQLLDIHRDTGMCSWGYYVGEKSLRSLKLALSLEMSMYDFVFDELSLECMHNDVFTENAAVLKLHEACGCKVERIGIGEVVKNGVAYDVAHSYLHAKDWREIRSTKKYEKIAFFVPKA